MKSAIVILAALIVGFSAQAARKTLICTDNVNQKWQLGYDLSTGKASIKSLGGNADINYKNAKVIQAMDGGPTVIDGRDNSKVNWAQEQACYVFGKLGVNVTLKRADRSGIRTGSLVLSPNIKTDPRTPNCSIPRLMRPPPRNLNCVVQATR